METVEPMLIPPKGVESARQASASGILKGTPKNQLRLAEVPTCPPVEVVDAEVPLIPIVSILIERQRRSG